MKSMKGILSSLKVCNPDYYERSGTIVENAVVGLNPIALNIFHPTMLGKDSNGKCSAWLKG